MKQGGQTCTTTSTTTTTTTPAPTTTTTSTTTTITTPPPYIYYVATRCDNPSLQQYFRTISSYVAGISVLYQGYCWEIQAQTGTSGVDAESVYISCTSCNGSNPTTTTTTTSSTTTTTTSAAVCTSWTVANFNGFGLGDTVNYVDCAGNPQSTGISDGNQFDICVLDSGFPPPYMSDGIGSVNTNNVPCT